MSGEEEWEVPIGLTKEHAICVDDSDDEEAVDGVAGPVGGSEAREKMDDSLQNDRRVDIATSQEENQCMFTADTNSKVPLKGNNVDVQSKISCDAQDMCNDNNKIIISEGVAEKQPSAAEQPSINNKETEAEDKAESVNPFASFAFVGGEAASTSSSLSWRTKKHTTTARTNKSLSEQQPIKRKNNVSSSVITKKRKAQALSHPFFSNTTTTKNNTISTTTNPLSNTEIAESKQNGKTERQILISKWHSFADPNAPIEQRRFQVLVAARLHARCQEPVVAKAMDKLRTYFDEKSMFGSISGADVDARYGKGQTSLLAPRQQSIQPHETLMQGLTVHSLASSNPETEIAPLLSSVLFGNTKANQIVQAAKDVLSKFGGKVPESMTCLKEITGIGPKLAEILYVVNRVDLYAS